MQKVECKYLSRVSIGKPQEFRLKGIKTLNSMKISIYFIKYVYFLPKPKFQVSWRNWYTVKANESLMLTNNRDIYKIE